MIGEPPIKKSRLLIRRPILLPFDVKLAKERKNGAVGNVQVWRASKRRGLGTPEAAHCKTSQNLSEEAPVWKFVTGGRNLAIPGRKALLSAKKVKTARGNQLSFRPHPKSDGPPGPPRAATIISTSL